MIRIFTVLFVGIFCTLTLAHADDPFLADEAKPGDNPAPSLGTPASAQPAAAAKSENVGTPSAPEAQAPVPLSAIPGKTPSAPPSYKGLDTSNDGKDIYDQYYEYLDQEKERQKSEKDMSQRSLFPHENGTWQFGLNYARNAFSGYNFDRAAPTAAIPNPPAEYATTQGANLLITWFPIHSLTVGRLGFGVSGGIYWSTFNTATPSIDNTGAQAGATVTKATPQEVTSYGVRAVYEFDYWLGQIIVPFAFLGADNVLIKQYQININTAASATPISVVSIDGRQLVSQYYGGGIHFNLNRVEPVVASRALVNVGIKKFYLTYMALQRTGDLIGLTHNLALTFEF